MMMILTTTELIKMVMKKICFTLALAASVMLACQKEENFQTNEKMSISVTASYPQLEDEADTKTYISEKSILWGKGEQMAIAVIGANAVFGQSSATDAYNGQNVAEFQFSIDNPTPSATGYVYAGIHPAAAVVLENNTDAAAYKVEVPAVQSATASSYDPDAYVLVAKPDTFTELQSKWTASYRRAAALNKITLTGISAAVSSVKISAPTEVALTGIRNIDLTTGESGEISSANNTVEITYSEPVSGASIDVWFASWGVELPEGSELVFEVSTGYSKYTRTITARAEGIKFVEGGLNTLTVNMSADDVDLDITDRYAAYNAGETIYVAGKAYSKAVNGEAKLIAASTENEDLLSNEAFVGAITAGGVLFLETPTGTSFSVNAGSNSTVKEILLISKSTDRVKLNLGASGRINLKAGFAVSGIDFTQVDRMWGLGANISHLHAENCSFTVPHNKPFIYATGNYIESIRFSHCQIYNNTTKGGSEQLFNFGANATLRGMKEIVFEDNIFYSAVTIKFTIINFSTKTQTVSTLGGEKLIMKNNLFYNCIGINRYFNLWHADSVEIDKNVHVCDTHTYGNASCVALYCNEEGASATNFVLGDNITFGGKAVYAGTASLVQPTVSNWWTILDATPLAGIPAEGNFTLVDSYKDYGPRM